MRTFANDDQRQGRQQNIPAKKIPSRHNRFSGGRGLRRLGRGRRLSAHQRADARTDRRSFRREGIASLPRAVVQKHLQISTQDLLCHAAKRGQKIARKQTLFPTVRTGTRLAHEAFGGDPDARQRVPTGSNVVGTRCCASGATATRNGGFFMSQPCLRDVVPCPTYPAYRHSALRPLLLEISNLQFSI